MKPKVSIIILNWNGYNDTKECLNSLKTVDYPDHDVIVVDNGSNDGSADKIGKEFPNIKLVKNSENLGFAGGNNVGIREALKSSPEYVLLLNNDVVVEKDFLSELVKAAGSDPAIGMASPKIYYYDRPKMIWFAGAKFNKYTGNSPHIGWREVDKGQYDVTREVGRLNGACMLVKRSVIEKIGMLDERFFFLAEEVDWCIRARKAGFKLVYVHSSKVWHKVSSSSGGEMSPLNLYYYHRNMLLLISKNYGLNPLILLRAAYMACKASILLLVPAKRKYAVAKLRGISDFFMGRFGRRYSEIQ